MDSQRLMYLFGLGTQGWNKQEARKWEEALEVVKRKCAEYCAGAVYAISIDGIRTHIKTLDIQEQCDVVVALIWDSQAALFIGQVLELVPEARFIILTETLEMGIQANNHMTEHCSIPSDRHQTMTGDPKSLAKMLEDGLSKWPVEVPA